MLPEAVMVQAKEEFLNWNEQGCSVMELSHRNQAFIEIAEQAEQDIRDLLNIPSNYKVLFMHGGGRGQFSAVPLNISAKDDSADYLITGTWSKSAIKEASRYLKTHESGCSSTDEEGLICVPNLKSGNLSSNSRYFHYCDNETVDGTEFFDFSLNTDVPIVADMSSNILSKPVDVSRFGVIYASAQKNIGPSGLSVVIVREDLLGQARPETPAILNYSLQAQNNSMFNTPPTYAWYLAGLVFKWLKAQGGVENISIINRQKADLLYAAIDENDFYLNSVSVPFRSRMNVPFQLANNELDSLFLAQAEEAGLLALKGHRSVGGMRASIYNAMPLEGVNALINFMNDFAQRNG